MVEAPFPSPNLPTSAQYDVILSDPRSTVTDVGGVHSQLTTCGVRMPDLDLIWVKVVRMGQNVVFLKNPSSGVPKSTTKKKLKIPGVFYSELII